MKRFYLQTTLIVVFFLQAFFSVEAQLLIGIEGGYDLNYIVGDISNRRLTKMDAGGGYSIGIKLDYCVVKHISVSIEPALIKKNYEISRTEQFAGLYQKYNNSYLQFPIHLNLWIRNDKKVNFYFKGGVYLAYWTSAKVTGNIASILNITDYVSEDGQINEFFQTEKYSEKYQFLSERDNRLEIGISGGGGVLYTFSERYSCFSEVKIFRSLSDLQRKYMINEIPKYNLTSTITIGCMVKISKRQK